MVKPQLIDSLDRQGSKMQNLEKLGKKNKNDLIVSQVNITKLR